MPIMKLPFARWWLIPALLVNLWFAWQLNVHYYRQADLAAFHDETGALLGGDFVNVYASGCAVWRHHAAVLLNQHNYLTWLRGMFGAEYPPYQWSYPPSWASLTWIACLASYPVAYGVYMGLTALLLYGFLRRAALGRAETLLLITSPIGQIVVWAGHNGFLTAFLIAAALVLRGSRRLGGPALAMVLLSIKPHLGLFLPVPLLIERRWKLIGLTLLGIALWVALTAFYFGWPAWQAYLFQTSAQQVSILTDWAGRFLGMMVSPYALARLNGLDAHTALVLQAVYSSILLAIYGMAMRLARSTEVCGLLTMGISVVAFPYLFIYDTLPLSIAVLLALRRRPQFAALYLSLPVAWFLIGRQFVQSALEQEPAFGAIFGQVLLFLVLVLLCRQELVEKRENRVRIH